MKPVNILNYKFSIFLIGLNFVPKTSRVCAVIVPTDKHYPNLGVTLNLFYFQRSAYTVYVFFTLEGLP